MSCVRCAWVTTGSTDMMALSFSALDKVGHDYGPESPEVQDVLVRLDRTIGTLLLELDRQIGQDNYVVALSADHGVAPLPERLATRGVDAGRIDPREIEQVAQAVLQKDLGPRRYVSQVLNGDIYLAPGVFERLKARPPLLESLASIARVDSRRSGRSYQPSRRRRRRGWNPAACCAELRSRPQRRSVRDPTALLDDSGQRYRPRIVVWISTPVCQSC